MTQRLVSLQVLRFAAALGVVWYHTVWLGHALGGPGPSGAYQRAGVVGAAGVDVFFVLSGFVITITGPLASPRPSGALFFWRRWSRVAPVYFLISLPLVAQAWVYGGLRVDKLAATFLFWPSVGTVVVFPYLRQGWTLSFEMIFYVGVALALAGGILRRWTAVAVLGALALASWINPIFIEFGFGIALAMVRRRLARTPGAIGLALIAVSLMAFTVEATVGIGTVDLGRATIEGTGSATRVVLFGLPAVALVAGALICERWCRGPLASLLAAGGDASYALYLTHTMTIAAIVAIGSGGPSPVALAFALSVAVGVACHRWIERPIIRDLKQLTSISLPIRTARKPPPAATPPQGAGHGRNGN